MTRQEMINVCIRMYRASSAPDMTDPMTGTSVGELRETIRSGDMESREMAVELLAAFGLDAAFLEEGRA